MSTYDRDESRMLFDLGKKNLGNWVTARDEWARRPNYNTIKIVYDCVVSRDLINKLQPQLPTISSLLCEYWSLFFERVVISVSYVFLKQFERTFELLISTTWELSRTWISSPRRPRTAAGCWHVRRTVAPPYHFLDLQAEFDFWRQDLYYSLTLLTIMTGTYLRIITCVGIYAIRIYAKRVFFAYIYIYANFFGSLYRGGAIFWLPYSRPGLNPTIHIWRN